MIAAVASSTIATMAEEQNVSAFNDKNNKFVFNAHSHTSSCIEADCTSNDGRVSNDESTHCNENFNSNRPEPPKFHCNDKPDNDK